MALAESACGPDRLLNGAALDAHYREVGGRQEVGGGRGGEDKVRRESRCGGAKSNGVDLEGRRRSSRTGWDWEQVG